MADSDSEAFESADEEHIEPKKEQKKGETSLDSTEAGNFNFSCNFSSDSRLWS